jgi:hypothetical protein
MAVTLTKLYEDVWSKTRIVGVQIAFDTSYPTGGYGASLGLSAQRIGFAKAGDIFGALMIGLNAAASGVAWVVWDYTNKKLMALRGGTGSITGNVTVVGGAIGEAIGINPDSNAGVLSKAAATNRTIPIATFLGAAPSVTQQPLAEVSNTTNLSAVTCRMEFRGR